jgi:hypothetical protein
MPNIHQSGAFQNAAAGTPDPNHSGAAFHSESANPYLDASICDAQQNHAD